MMNAPLVKPLAIVDNRTGHLMLLVDARTLSSQIEGGAPCRLRQDQGRLMLDVDTDVEPVTIGPFSRAEVEKIKFCHRLTIAAFRDGIVTRAREVSLEPMAEAI